MKKYRTNIIILILISILIMYLIMKDDFYNIIVAIKNVDIKFLLIALIFMTLCIFSIIITSFIFKIYKKRL